jgi:tetratricopeptide (TPR) repeat protein
MERPGQRPHGVAAAGPPDVLIDDVREYIKASITADEEKVEREQTAARRQLEQQRKRTRVAVGLGTVALVFAIGAGWLWNKASDEADRANTERSHAERNLALAQRAANGLVFDLVDGLKPLSGVSNETIRRILGRADTLLEELAGGETASPSMRRLRAATHLQFADAYLAQGDLAAAGAAAEQGRQILDLLAQDQSDEQAQRDLSVSWDRLGDVRRAQGDLPGALRAYDDARTIRANLAAADPGNAEWQRDLSISWEKLGSVHEEQENRADALKAWRAALAVSGRFPENFPDSIDMVTTPVIHLAGVARTLDPADAQAPAEAARLLDRALALLRPLDEAGRLDADRHGWIAWIEQRRAALKQP